MRDIVSENLLREVARAQRERFLTTGLLDERARRGPNHEAELQCVYALADSLATSSEKMLQTLADTALLLCDAASAGISLIERDDTGLSYFRWVATAGLISTYTGNTTPIDESPCGVTLALGGVQLFAYPQRHFDCLKGPMPEVVEGLVVPILGQCEPWGTIWVMSHDENARFDAEDARVLMSLASFVGAALVVERAKTAAETRAEEAEAARVALQASEKAMSNAIAMIAHELRGPLAPMTNALEAIYRLSDSNQPFLSALDIAQRQTRHLGRLVDDLLDASRIRYDKVALERNEMVLQEIVRDATALLLPDINHRKHSLELNLPEAPVVVVADSGRLIQILTNVISNAAKYTPDGGLIHVSVTTREPSPLESAGRTEASIEITDNGMGISKNALPRVFDMFVQSRTCDASREGGLGIGLAVVKHLVSLHDGTVEIKSDGEGCGTTVLIRLPVRAPRTKASSD
ncbi:Two-component hybrid sensor and regulator [Caballeronia sordidicola]|uniref:histidine kinase n=1 Tax=Caballeronia sordidicola TaxID=196367 RepID=A0A242MU10_CABSO|nr:Two-component hybrid sensor and regulator [Caballeronia sordidicola]